MGMYVAVVHRLAETAGSSILLEHHHRPACRNHPKSSSNTRIVVKLPAAASRKASNNQCLKTRRMHADLTYIRMCHTTRHQCRSSDPIVTLPCRTARSEATTAPTRHPYAPMHPPQSPMHVLSWISARTRIEAWHSRPWYQPARSDWLRKRSTRF